MSELRVAQRYARALLSYAAENNTLDQIKGEANSLITALQQFPEISKIVSREDVALSKRLSFLDQLSAGLHLSPALVNLLRLVASRGKFAAIPSICKFFIKMADERAGLKRIKVCVADPNLLEPACNAAADSIKNLVGGEVVCEGTVDKKILGGAIIKIGDAVGDFSVATKLQKIEESLCETQVLQD